MPRATRWDRHAWTGAALQALAERGVAGVAVEPLAARLGATKGSFYAHFPDRDALLEATLALWEQRGTDDLIRSLDALTDPAARLRDLFAQAFGEPGLIRAELALLADADHPLIGPVLERVTARRLDYLTAQFTALGFTRAEARNRAMLSYTAFLGLHQVERVSKQASFASAAARRRYPGFLLPLLLEPA